MADKKRRTGSNPLNSFLNHIPDYTEKEDDSEQSKSETKSEPKTETKSEPKTETKSEPKTEPKTETKSEPKSETKSEPKTETKSEPKSEAKSETKSETFSQTFASDIKESAAAQSEQQRFEENRKRQTYWLDHKTIAMISELAERSGRNKYHVVSAGVQMLYEYVFESTEDEEAQ